MKHENFMYCTAERRVPNVIYYIFNLNLYIYYLLFIIFLTNLAKILRKISSLFLSLKKIYFYIFFQLYLE